MQSIFFNARRLRAGWRLLLFLAIFLLLAAALAGPLSLLYPELGEPTTPLTSPPSLLLDGSLLLPLLLVSWLMARYIDRRPFASLGLHLGRAWGKEFLLGTAVGLAMGAIYLAVGSIFGVMTVTWNNAAWGGLATLVFGFFLAAAFEETLFHGYAFQTLIEGLGVYPALFLVSVVFSLFHRSNPGISLLGLINIGLAGLLLALGYLRTRALGLPIGLHFSWNIFQIIFSFPVSGLAFRGPFSAELQGSELITGGPFGPEGSIIATVVFAGAIAFVLLSKRIKPSPVMEALWKEHLHPLAL